MLQGSQTAVCLDGAAGVWMQGGGQAHTCQPLQSLLTFPLLEYAYCHDHCQEDEVECIEAIFLFKKTRGCIFSCVSAPAAAGPASADLLKSLLDSLTLVWVIDGVPPLHGALLWHISSWSFTIQSFLIACLCCLSFILHVPFCLFAAGYICELKATYQLMGSALFLLNELINLFIARRVFNKRTSFFCLF